MFLRLAVGSNKLTPCSRIGTPITLVSIRNDALMKTLAFLGIAAIFSISHSEQAYLGLYMQGNKIGYATYSSEKGQYLSKPVQIGRSHTLMDTGLLGTALKLEMDSITWTTPKGAPLRMHFVMSSGGRSQKIDALFNGPKVDLIIVNGGQRSERKLDVPQGFSIVDDPLSLVVAGEMKAGTSKRFYILDPMTASFIKNDVKIIGPSKVTVKGVTKTAMLVMVIDPRAPMSVYLSPKGDIVKAEGPMGLEMIPETREAAMKPSGKYDPSVDLAYSTSIKPDKDIPTPGQLTVLNLRITGRDLSNIPSDDHQTVTKDGDSWIVKVHPTRFDVGQPSPHKPNPQEWLKSGLNIPSNDPQMISLAAKITTGQTTVVGKARKIQLWVNEQMRPNAGIGVLRDAREILKTKEGVCRDYAVLTATLLRAAHVPARLASGLVNWDGTFYYHAWVEAWDGSHWVGVDSTTSDPQLAANHIKLADGTIETAFSFTFLDKVKVQVLDAHGKN